MKLTVPNRPTEFHVSPGYQPLMRMLGLDAETVFDHAEIKVWRKLPDRENCTLDADLPDGRHVRLHVKRYESADAALPEVEGHRLLESKSIPTAPLVGWGTLEGRRSFVIFDDLAGFTPADKLVERGTPFCVVLEASAELAVKLHAARLHHRDLYLCHFMAREGGDDAEIRLIDTARVRRLPAFLARRWIVKDLSQFWYSTLKLPVTEEQRVAWLNYYSVRRGVGSVNTLKRAIERKVRSIARHDARIHRDRPERDVSIPTQA